MCIHNMIVRFCIIASCLLSTACGLMSSQPYRAEVREGTLQNCDCPVQTPAGILASKKEIEEIQARLIVLGYPAGIIDGVVGPATQKAIKAYQADHKLLTDGRPSPELLQHIQQSALNF